MHLHRDMTVAEVIRRPGDQQRVIARRLEQRFIRRHDFDLAAVLRFARDPRRAAPGRAPPSSAARSPLSSVTSNRLLLRASKVK